MTVTRRRQPRKRIVGEHFREDGSPKRRFATEREAREYVETFGYHCSVYPCSFAGCNGYHLGTRRGPRLF